MPSDALRVSFANNMHSPKVVDHASRSHYDGPRYKCPVCSVPIDKSSSFISKSNSDLRGGGTKGRPPSTREARLIIDQLQTCELNLRETWGTEDLVMR